MKKATRQKVIKELYDKQLITLSEYENACSFYQFERKKNPDALINNLIGLGVFFIAISIITFFAINWVKLGVSVRALLSFIPLFITIAISWFAIFENDGKKKETKKLILSIFAPIAIIASNALIDQTFQLQTTFYDIVINSIWMFIPIAIYTSKIPALIVLYIGLLYGINNIENGIFTSLVFYGIAIVYNVFSWLKDKHSKKTYNLTLLSCAFTLNILAVYEFISFYEFFVGIFISLEFLKLLFKDMSNRLNRRITFIVELAFVLYCLIPNAELDYNILTAGIALVMYVGLFIYNKSYKNMTSISALAMLICLLAGTQLLSNIILIAISAGYFYFGYQEGNTSKTTRGLLIMSAWALSKLLISELSFEEKSILFLVIGVGFIIVSKILKKKIGGVNNEENK